MFTFTCFGESNRVSCAAKGITLGNASVAITA
jgi:hypothetical protein